MPGVTGTAGEDARRAIAKWCGRHMIEEAGRLDCKDFLTQMP